MNYQNQVAIIIPSLNPDHKMIQLVRELSEIGFQKIVIVNDGSGEEYEEFYKTVVALHGCIILNHAVNMGKGRALKDAFNYVLTHWQDCIGVVTVDADGQHSVQDVLACAQELLKYPEYMILGCRNFSKENIPKRSKFGNILTRKVLSFLCGIHVSDTQTGLRGLSRSLMEGFLTITGERYEFEMNALIATREKNIEILEVPIQTIYIENNKTSHFNPLTDSIRIYALFLKYLFTGLSSFTIDVLLFTILVLLLKNVSPVSYIVISTAVARILSSIYNFFMNKNNVFESNGDVRTTFVKYYILCIVQMAISAGGVVVLYPILRIHETFIKVVVDTLLFFISYQIQMKWVFRNNE